MINLNGSKGLGDALYVRAVARHLVNRNKDVTVFTRWPVVFDGMPLTIRPLEARNDAEDLRHVIYCSHCRVNEPQSLNFFTLACKQAGIVEQVELYIDWQVKSRKLVDTIRDKARGRRVFVYQSPKRANSAEEASLRPHRSAFNSFVANHGDCFRVKLGHSSSVDIDASVPCDLDLFDKTTVQEALDVCASADLLFSDPSFVTVMGEAMGKRFTAMLSRRAAESPSLRARSATPERLFHNKHLMTVVYDE